MRFVLALVLVLLAPLAWAQTADEIQNEEWQKLVQETEQLLEQTNAPDGRLTELRSQLSERRAKLLKAQDINAGRLEALQSEIAALGPAPGPEEEEPDHIATLRTELEQELERVSAPARAAQAAYSRTDGLVREIDNVLREREAREMLTRGDTPLSPGKWSTTFEDSIALTEKLAGEFAAAISDEQSRSLATRRLPEVVLLLGLALILLLRGRRVTERLANLPALNTYEAASGVLSFLVSLGQVILPVLGVILLVQALERAALLGELGSQIGVGLVLLTICLSVARWLALRLFPPVPASDESARMDRSDRREMRTDVAGLGVLLWLAAFADLLNRLNLIRLDTKHIVLFVAIVLAGPLLLRMSLLLRRYSSRPDTDENDISVTPLRLTSQILRVIGVVGPLAAALGYIPLAQRLVFATILSLALLAFIMVLHRLVRDAYILLTRSNAARASEALAPVLISFLLVLLGLPVFSLIWGARVTDLFEVWARVQRGFAFGETRISPTDFLVSVVVFTIGYILTRLIQATLRISVLPRTKLDVGGRNAVTVGVGYVGIVLAAMLAITAAGISLASLAIVAGALSIGIGFGLQNIVSNFVSGIILLIERPISEGDWIEVNGRTGHVRAISVRSTRIETFDRTDVIVPNADLVSGTVTNWTRGNLTGRAIVTVGVAYGTDTRRVEAILHEVAESHPMVALNPPPVILFQGFGASSLDFEIRAILRDVNWLLTVRSELNHEIARRFAEEGIEIPFPQRDVWLRSPSGGATMAPPAAAGPAEAPVTASADHINEDDL